MLLRRVLWNNVERTTAAADVVIGVAAGAHPKVFCPFCAMRTNLFGATLP